MKQFRDTGYFITTCGKVWSSKNNKFLVPAINDKGYLTVGLCINGKVHRFRIHRLVAECYIPNPENKPQVNHKDGVKLHCWKNNLEWATNKENSQHACDTGLHEPITKDKMSLDNICKPVLQILDGDIVGRYNSLKDAEDNTKVPHQNISKVCNGDRRSAGGFQWEFNDANIL